MSDYDTSSISSEEDVENKEETSQQWVYRHLVQFTNCEDISAKTLVDGDCSPLIQLLTDMTQTKTLFITVTKPVQADLSTTVVEPPPAPVVLPPKKVKSQKKLKKPKRRKKRKLKKKGKEDKKGKKSKKDKKNDVPLIPEPVLITMDNVPDMIFEWISEQEIPNADQFLFFIPKSKVPNTEASLDELYHVGYIRNQRHLKAALKCLEKVFREKLTYAMKIYLLLQINGIDDLKIPKDLVFEKFIIDNISRNYNIDGRIRNIESDARSITLILSQTLQAFCNLPDSTDRARLLIQLSFYDIEFLSEFPEIHVTSARFEQALDHMSLLQFLYKEEVTEWNRKTYLYLLDLFSTILAHEITRKSNFMTNYAPEKKVGPICASFKKVVQKFVSVCREIFETQEDWAATNKVSFSFYIVGILEEEIDSIIEKVEEMNSESRDMSLDRSAIHATKVILSELDVYLQEKCLESAVESGNLESLRSLAATIVKHNRRLERVVALY
ncbi:unnamed protein product [Caenorhabditis angaria]|uniref:Uncharacterized protein n=1 Tax=Caenorhabditis angaria TaxID=860376 RepID=A0A9P1J0U5_9PELO|nr:unnamed protein product [Caenorhabditis angaria]